MDHITFRAHLAVLLDHVDATAELAAADFPLINAPDGLTESDVDFFIDDAADLVRSQSHFLEDVAARYRRALARAVNARLFSEKR